MVWSSCDNVVATVNQYGEVSALSPGTAIITATTINRGLTATCKVNVSNTVRISDDLSTVYVPLLKDGWSITGTQVDNNYRYDIADGATVTLDNVTIGTYGGYYHSADEDEYAGLNCLGNATIILKGKNSVTGRNRKFPGIHVPKGKTLTIRGDGSLIAKSFGNGAGIGGGNGIECGNIVIEGGNIVAEGGDGAAGIGSGANASCGNIVIKGSTITAKGGDGAAGIGGGANASCGNVTVTNGVESVTATKGNGAPYSIGAGRGGSCGTVTIDGKTGAISQSPYTFATTDFDVDEEYVVDLGTLTEDYTVFDGDVLTGTLAKNVKISIASGATVMLRNATINGVNNDAYKWAGLTCRGNATIVLAGTNSVRGFHEQYPGIHIPQGKTLTIKGKGTLNASGNGSQGGAGIGGAYKLNCGNIRIEGGTINATGGHGCAGIGAGSLASCGTITITSGVTSVTATKGGYAPYSIGPGNHGTCGTVTIGGKETGPISESPYTYKP